MDFGNFDIFVAKDEVAAQERVLLLESQQVYPDPHNVRRAIRQEEIDALAQTIRTRGQLQPIIVAPADDDGRYMIQFGERRWRACQQLGLSVRAIIREVLDAAQIRIDQFIENDQREHLSVPDMIAFVADQVASGMSIADLARATGRDRPRRMAFGWCAFRRAGSRPKHRSNWLPGWRPIRAATSRRAGS